MRFFKKSTQHFYNQIAWIYPVGQFYFRSPKMFMESMFQTFSERKHVLDVGGVFSARFLQNTQHHISGIDFSDKMSKHLQPHYEKFYLHDVHLIDELDGGLKYDYIILGFVIAVLNDRKMVIDKLINRLLPGGKIIIINHFSSVNNIDTSRLYGYWAKKFATIMHFDYEIKIKDLKTDKTCIQSVKCIDKVKKIYAVVLYNTHEH